MSNKARYRRIRTDSDGFISDSGGMPYEYIGRASEFDLYRGSSTEPDVYCVLVSAGDKRLTQDVLKRSGGNAFYFRYDPSKKDVSPMKRAGLSLINPTALEMVHLYRALKEPTDGG